MPRRTSDPEMRAAEDRAEEHVAGRMRLRRGLLGLSQSELARALGITFQQVQKYERGSNRISIGKLVRLAEVLDVPISFFFDGIAGEGGAVGHADPADAVAAGVLGRRDLDLLRAWRSLPPDVADSVAALVRAAAEPHGEPPVPDPSGELPADPPPPRRRGRPRRNEAAPAAGTRRRKPGA